MHAATLLELLPPLGLAARVLVAWKGGVLFVREVRGSLAEGRPIETVVLVAGTGSLLLDVAYELIGPRAGWPRPALGVPPALRGAGLLLFGAGSVLQLWARRALGGAWTVRMAAPSETALVTRGPYGLVRHPIYATAIASYLGLLIAQADLVGLIVFGAQVAGYARKAAVEDAILARSLQPAYERYRRRVRWRLLPGLWMLG